MKKLLLFLLVIFTCLSVLASCQQIEKFLDKDQGGEVTDSDENTDEIPEETPEEKPEDKPEDFPEDKPEEKPEDIPEDKPEEKPTYLYNGFTPSEKNILTTYIGEIIPFASNNEYYLEGYYDVADYENGVNFYTLGNTKEDFEGYRALYSDYELIETYADEYGDTWYRYQKGDIIVDMSYYLYEGNYYIDVFVYVESATENPGGGTDNPGGGTDNPGGDTENSYKYTDFSNAEKNLFIDFIGEIIPFIPTNDYYVEEGYDEYYEENYINFYTFGNTQADFESYLDKLVGYSLIETYEDSYGDTWYCYEKGDIYIEVSFYFEQENVFDLYVFGPQGSTGGEGGDSGNTGNGDNGNTDKNVITNAGAGLPQGTNGVYDVDFTQATNVKDVTDQGYYLDGCPTVGSPAVLVIPVEFSDATASSKGYSIDNIANAFNGGTGTTDYYSVYEYYYISSGGKLDLEITILDEWFRPTETSSYYENATYDYYGDTVSIGDQLIINEALDYLDDYMDLSKFDSDNNGIIDAIVIINTLDVDDSTEFNWAYRYWNIYTDDEGYYYEYDGVSANDYLWASYQFMHESYDENGDVYYSDTSVMNTYTYIHEFAHVLGVDDYYDTAYESNPLDGADIMDAMAGDHNAYTKFNLGWITSSRLVTTDSSVTLTLDAFSKNGDTIIIANNFDPTLGVYQEYYIVVYYTMDGLNGGEYGYFARDGIIVYHVNASLYTEVYEGETYYDIYNTNTSASDPYGTVDNLIEFVKSAEGNFTFVAGESLPTLTDDQGNTLGYSFTVESLSQDSATITFTKK